MENENIFISLPKDLVRNIRRETTKNGQSLSGFFKVAAIEKIGGETLDLKKPTPYYKMESKTIKTSFTECPAVGQMPEEFLIKFRNNGHLVLEFEDKSRIPIYIRHYNAQIIENGKLIRAIKLRLDGKWKQDFTYSMDTLPENHSHGELIICPIPKGELI